MPRHSQWRQPATHESETRRLRPSPGAAGSSGVSTTPVPDVTTRVQHADNSTPVTYTGLFGLSFMLIAVAKDSAARLQNDGPRTAAGLAADVDADVHTGARDTSRLGVRAQGAGACAWWKANCDLLLACRAESRSIIRTLPRGLISYMRHASSHTSRKGEFYNIF